MWQRYRTCSVDKVCTDWPEESKSNCTTASQEDGCWKNGDSCRKWNAPHRHVHPNGPCRQQLRSADVPYFRREVALEVVKIDTENDTHFSLASNDWAVEATNRFPRSGCVGNISDSISQMPSAKAYEAAFAPCNGKWLDMDTLAMRPNASLDQRNRSTWVKPRWYSGGIPDQVRDRSIKDADNDQPHRIGPSSGDVYPGIPLDVSLLCSVEHAVILCITGLFSLQGKSPLWVQRVRLTHLRCSNSTYPIHWKQTVSCFFAHTGVLSFLLMASREPMTSGATGQARVCKSGRR